MATLCTDSRARERALLLRELYGPTEAARRTGVPAHAIDRWRATEQVPRQLWRMVDPYLRFGPRERERLSRRAFEGCRCDYYLLEPDGLCLKCGHPCDWDRWRETMRDALAYLKASSAE